MGSGPNWTDAEIMHLGFLVSAGFRNTEISKVTGRTLASIQMAAKKFYGGNANYINQISKHKHLRGPVFEYFMTHSYEQTQKRFSLKDSELKSIFTVGYRDPKYKHLRKDTRNKDVWTTENYKFLLQHSGLRPRSWIAKKIGKGNAHSCIKERLTKLGVSSRTLNGLTLNAYRQIFQKEPRVFISTDAGPGRGCMPSSYFKIIPWVQVEADIKDKYVFTKNKPFVKSVKTMALFQDWIFEGNAMKKIRKIEAAV